MKAKEIRGMDVKGLDEKLVELKKELIKINAQVAVGTTIKKSRPSAKNQKNYCACFNDQTSKSK